MSLIVNHNPSLSTQTQTQSADMQMTSTGDSQKSFKQLLFLEKGYQHSLILYIVNKLPAVCSLCSTDVQSTEAQGEPVSKERRAAQKLCHSFLLIAVAPLPINDKNVQSLILESWTLPL